VGSVVLAFMEHPDEASFYVCFYAGPTFFLEFMRYIDMPHWVPQVLIYLCLWQCCTPTEEEEEDTITATAEDAKKEATAKSDLSKTKGTRSSISTESKSSRLDDIDTTKLLLSIVRAILLECFIMDGFSSEFGRIMALPTRYRLLLASLLNMIRMGHVSSSLLWSSLCLQLLLATEMSAKSSLVDPLIFVIGLTSIRLKRKCTYEAIHYKGD
jgi:hypothetical protein